jgi:competence CoiA-like predicted nuclease
VHENLKPFQCQTCSSKFGAKSGLQVHTKTAHENLKPF